MTTDDIDRSSEPRQTDDADAAQKARSREYHHARYIANREQKQEYDRVYRAANRERIKTRKRLAYEAEDPDKRRDRNRAYAAATREKRREYHRTWSEANRGKVREYARAGYAANRTKRQEQHRAHYLKNREKILERDRAWQKANPDKVREIDKLAKQRRRAKQRGGKNTFTRDDWQTLVARSKRCHWCQIRFTQKNPPTHDHVIPISRGGGNTLDNSVCACRSCNSRKSAGSVNPINGQGILL